MVVQGLHAAARATGQPCGRSCSDIADAPTPGSVDLVVGIEARGFIIGAAVAYELGIGFVPVRKAGKLPGETLHVDYELEYGSATIEVHADAFVAGDRVLVVDDVLATGGTAVATCELLERAGATVVAFEAVIELALPARPLASRQGRDVHTTVVGSTATELVSGRDVGSVHE